MGFPGVDSLDKFLGGTSVVHKKAQVLFRETDFANHLASAGAIQCAKRVVMIVVFAAFFV